MAMTTGTMAGALHAGAVGMGMGVGELGGGKRGRRPSASAFASAPASTSAARPAALNSAVTAVHRARRTPPRAGGRPAEAGRAVLLAWLYREPDRSAGWSTPPPSCRTPTWRCRCSGRLRRHIDTYQPSRTAEALAGPAAGSWAGRAAQLPVLHTRVNRSSMEHGLSGVCFISWFVR
jgi:hypothetical protein